jgi:AcrR family transcriptional regulator
MTGDSPRTERPPRRRRRDARPSEIIEAGLREFAEQGFAAARLEDIARRAGIAKGTIYRYFDSKEALFEAVLLSRAGGIIGNMEAAIAAHDGPMLPLMEVVIGEFYRELRQSDILVLMRIIIADGERFPRVTEFYFNEIVRRGLAVIGGVVRRGIERGEFRESAVTAIPQVLLSPAIMMAVWSMTFQRIQPIDVATMRDAHVELITRALEPHRR